MKVYPIVFLDEPHLDLLYAQQFFFKRSGFPFEPTTIFVGEGFSPDVIRQSYLESQQVNVIVRPPGFWPPPTWEHCMSKLGAYREFIYRFRPNDEDYIMDMDADSFLTGARFLSDLGKADVMGHFWTNLATPIERLGGVLWSPVSGACMLFRISAVRRMLGLGQVDLIWIKNWLLAHPPFGLVHDHFLPLAMRISGATEHRPDGPWFSEGKSAEQALLSRDPNSNVAHLYGDWKYFGGLSVKNKCDVPRALKKLGIIT